MTKHNLLYVVVLAVIAGLCWTIGRTQPQLQARGGPAPPAATVVFERTTQTGIAIQQVYAYDANGNGMISRTTSRSGTKRRVKNRVNGTDLSFDDSLGVVIEKSLSTRDKAALDQRFLGNNSECQSNSKLPIVYSGNPAIGTILGYRVVKHTLVTERPACSDGTCPAESRMIETWYSPELGCLPLRKRHTFTNQETGRARAVVDQTAVSVTRSVNNSLFARNSARKVKPTELLRLQADRRPEIRKDLNRKLRLAEQARLDERIR